MKNIYGYIYLTTNLVNGRRYVGQHLKIKLDKNYYGSGIYIKNGLRKYKKKNFNLQLLEYVYVTNKTSIRESKNKITILREQLIIDQQEAYWINKLNTWIESKGKGYNLNKSPYSRGSLSQSTKDLISKSQKGIPEKYPVWNKGIPTTPEAIKKYKKTWKNKSQKEKNQKLINYQKTMSLKPKEEIQVSIDQMKKTKVNKTFEEKANKIKKFKITRKNKSQFEKDEQIRKGQETKKINWGNLSKKDQKEKIRISNKKRKITMSLKTEKETKEHSNKISQALIGVLKSPIHIKKAKEGYLKFLSNMTEKEAQEFYKKKCKKKKETEANRTKERIKEILHIRKISSQKIKNKPKITCQYCQEVHPEHLLKRHEKTCKNNPNREIHKCPYCNYVGTRLQDLNTHIKRNHYTTPKRTPR